MRKGDPIKIIIDVWDGDQLKELKELCRKYDSESKYIDPTTGEQKPCEWLN